MSAIYIVGAIVIWLEFLGSPPDGLANIWIAVYTFPIVIIGTFLLHGVISHMCLVATMNRTPSTSGQVLPFLLLLCS
jgi:polyferredoxin